MSLPREGEVRIPSGCAVSGMFSKSGKRMNGEQIIRSIEVMHDRSNGLGGGFAAYGIYPEYKEYYAFHIFYDDSSTKQECERFLERHFDIINLSKIPTRKMPQITDVPLIWRYFVTPLPTKLAESQLDEREFVAKCVFHINTRIKGSYVFSSGKNMGVFKAVGFPEDVGRFYRLDEYAGYCFTAHGRYPTNTPGWWGAHTPSPCWITRLSTTGRFPPMTQTAVPLKCTATNVLSRRIRRSLPISSTTCTGSRG